jgi:hypothetical protein
MSKSRITWLLIASVIAGVLGGIFVTIGWFANPDDVFVRNGTDIVSVRETASAVGLFGLGFVGGLGIVVAAITGIAAWIGALLNTAGFERKRWFVAIALLGAINCGLLGVLAYLVAGPSATRRVTTAPAVTAGSPA